MQPVSGKGQEEGGFAMLITGVEVSACVHVCVCARTHAHLCACLHKHV